MPCRRHAGGFPARMAVKKNKFIEEWNGKREITEKTFAMDFGDVPTFLLMIVIFPYGVYTWTRSEFLNRGDPRFKDVFWKKNGGAKQSQSDGRNYVVG